MHILLHILSIINLICECAALYMLLCWILCLPVSSGLAHNFQKKHLVITAALLDTCIILQPERIPHRVQ